MVISLQELSLLITRSLDTSTVTTTLLTLSIIGQIYRLGGSYRQYELNSNGTIFTDKDGPITYNEYGAYTQIQKKFADERLESNGFSSIR